MFSEKIIEFERRFTGPVFWIVFSILFFLLIFVYSKLIVYRYPTSVSGGLTISENSFISDFVGACSAADLQSQPFGKFTSSPSISTPDLGNSRSGSFNQSLRSLLTDATVRVIVEDGSGTGFFINENTIVTNRHVVENSQTKILLAHPKWDGRLLEGRLIALTPEKKNPSDLDFAIIRVVGDPKFIKYLKLASLAEALLPVVAVGFPGIVIDQDQNQISPETVFSQGVISVLQKQTAGHTLLNHTANIARGNSGGPLTNMCGAVVGINTFVAAEKENIDGRSLYSLSSVDLASFLKKNKIEFTSDTASCER